MDSIREPIEAQSDHMEKMQAVIDAARVLKFNEFGTVAAKKWNDLNRALSELDNE